MRIEVGSTEIKKLFAFILPAVIILSQWLSVGGINISWLLYILLFFLVFLRLDMLRQNAELAVFSGAVIFIPFFSYLFGIADSFQYSLYFSLATSLIVLLFICSMDTDEYDAFIKGVLFSCILFSVWGIYEIFTGHYVLFSNDAFFNHNWVGLHYPGVAFANTNDLVQYLVLLFPISGHLLFRRSKWLFIMLSLAMVFITFQASSKLGMIALVMILLLVFVTSMFTSGNANKIGKLLFVGIGILLVLWVYDLFTGTISTIVDNFFVIDTNADYYTGRDNIYTPLLRHSLTHPFGGFGSAYVVTEMPPHNLLLYILCDYGWIPCLVAVILVIKMALFSLKKAREQNGNAFWCLLFGALCLFILTSSISSCNEQRKAVWMFLGICVRNVYLAPYGGGEVLCSKWMKLTWGKG